MDALVTVSFSPAGSGRPSVRAYTNAFSYEPGEMVRLHVSASGSVRTRLIRMRSSSVTDAFGDEDVDWPAAGQYAASLQETCVGSFLLGALRPHGSAAGGTRSFGAFIWSADFAAARVQTILSFEDGTALQLHDGHPALIDPTVEEPVATKLRLTDHSWYFVVGTVGEVRSVRAVAVDPMRGATAEATGAPSSLRGVQAGLVTIGARRGRAVVWEGGLARGQADEHFNGKIESPFDALGPIEEADARSIARGRARVDELDLIGGWDLSFVHGDVPAKAMPMARDQPPGVLVNGPARGVTGHRFSGRCLSFGRAPEEYAAAHFHATDMVDAGWQPLLDGRLPDDLESGVYGLVVEGEHGSDTVPIVVVPRPTDSRKKILLVLPTFTYLAYANEAQFEALDPEALTGGVVTIASEDLARKGDSSFGLSMYDSHPDSSGVMFSTARRQIANMRRGYQMWLVGAGRAFSADMYLVEWLARRGIDVDVITDHELHSRDADYIAPYAVVVTGSHPEYVTEEILDRLLDYRDAGGSLMYLGANGWYWVTGVLSHEPLIVEIRRGHAGTRPWESLPGEVDLMATGLPGGLWRHRGRAPQLLAGVGFAAQGWGTSEPYFRSAAASSPEWAWVFDGAEDDPMGAYGLVMGGAAGDELDRADVALGTPPDAVVLASSRGHTNRYQRVVEETPTNHPDQTGGQQDPEVHADLVYFTTPGGGEVFSTGSIAWIGSLLHNGTENGISRITENVLRAFIARRE